MIKSFWDLEVYQRTYQLAMEISTIAKKFPKVEAYSLASQIIRSSRLIATNLSEGWARRTYENVFKQFIINSLGSASETQTWLDVALNCEYITKEEHQSLNQELVARGQMLTQLHKKWKTI
ncbi:MAG: four helix bundle protein [Cyclobacteriaceae bacterium]